MGLDILIEANSKTDESRILSRQFSREMVDFSEKKSNSIIWKILKRYEFEIALFEAMNVWDVEKTSWEAGLSITKVEFDERNIIAWQPVSILLRELMQLEKRMQENFGNSGRFEYENKWQEKYFENLNKLSEGTDVQIKFGHDVVQMIKFLKVLEPNGKVKFHYF